MRAKEFTQHLQDLVIFDIDDTLLHTTARIRVVDSDGRVLRELTNQEFNNYQLQPGETFDFGEFRSAEKFQRESQPIEPMIRKLKTILNHAGRARVIMLTARADFDDKEKFLQTFRDLGIDMSRIHVHRAGNLPGDEPPAQKKAVWVRRYLDTGRYGHVRLYDDSMSNLRVFRSLKNEYPDVDFRAIYVSPRGDTATINENKSSGISKIVQDFVSSGIGKKYQKHDCKTVTRAFVKWASTNNISTQVLSLAPPHPDVIKKRPELRGKSGEGDGHIMPVVGGYALDFTARQFLGQAGYVYSNPLITPVSEVSTVYKKIGGYFTYAPNWFIVNGKPATHYLGPLESIPSDIFNQNFGDELLEGRRRNKKKAKFAYSGPGYWGGYWGGYYGSSEQSGGEGGLGEGMSWSALDQGLSLDDKMAIFESVEGSYSEDFYNIIEQIMSKYAGRGGSDISNIASGIIGFAERNPQYVEGKQQEIRTIKDYLGYNILVNPKDPDSVERYRRTKEQARSPEGVKKVEGAIASILGFTKDAMVQVRSNPRYFGEIYKVWGDGNFTIAQGNPDAQLDPKQGIPSTVGDGFLAHYTNLKHLRPQGIKRFDDTNNTGGTISMKQGVAENTVEQVKEYVIIDRYDPSEFIKYGKQNKDRLKLVDTPLTMFNVRYDDMDRTRASYYFYDKQTDKCVGFFTVQTYAYDTNFTGLKRKLKSGIKAVTPHIGLAREFRRQGISTLIYNTFLRGGPWVFVTSRHSESASKLWNSLVKDDIISFYVSDDTGKIIKTPNSYYDYRVLGPKDRFNIKPQGVAEGVNDYLWHGSKTEHDILYPQQANDTGGKEESNKNAVYATPSAKTAIAMGLTTPGSDTGMFPNDPQMVLFSGNIRKGQMVYLHKVPKDLFIKHNSREWYSKPGVEAVKPIEVITIPVDQWLHLIRQATPQDLELRKKYMKKQGVAEGNLNEFAPRRNNGDNNSPRWYNDQEIAAIVGRGWINELGAKLNSDEFDYPELMHNPFFNDMQQEEMIDLAQDWLEDHGYKVRINDLRNNKDFNNRDWLIRGNFVNPDNNVSEDWSKKYKRSINCSRPRGFSQRAHCQGRKKK